MMGVISIASDHRTRTVELRWQGGREQRWPAVFLRSQCRCAGCKAASLRGEVTAAPNPSLQVTDIRMVGAYGVQFIFSDGHDRGIFPWAYLEQLGAAPSHIPKDKTNEQAA